jgi:hypothetical protein
MVAPELAAIEVHGITRESFLLRATLAAGAAYGALSATPYITRALAQSAGGDVDVVNYALTLEYLESAFYANALKQATGLNADETTFDFGGAFATPAAFLKTANVLEDTGVSAYNGAATAITSADVLATAGAIVQIEARHAALIRLARGKPPAPLAFDKASEMDAVLKAARPFIVA